MYIYYKEALWLSDKSAEYGIRKNLFLFIQRGMGAWLGKRKALRKHSHHCWVVCWLLKQTPLVPTRLLAKAFAFNFSMPQRVCWLQKPARQAHCCECKCHSCTKSRHHQECNCPACTEYQRHKHHDDLRCSVCRTRYIHRARTDRCGCSNCKSARKHQIAKR